MNTSGMNKFLQITLVILTIIAGLLHAKHPRNVDVPATRPVARA